MTRQYSGSEVGVPQGIEFALVDDGLVRATVMWREDDAGVLRSQIYAPTDEDMHKIPAITLGLGDWYRRKVSSGELIEYAEVNHAQTYRVYYEWRSSVDAYRFTQMEQPRGHACLEPQKVYLLYAFGRKSPRTRFRWLVAQVRCVETANLGQKSLLPTSVWDREFVLHKDEVVVWNEEAQARLRPRWSDK